MIEFQLKLTLALRSMDFKYFYIRDITNINFTIL